MMFLIENLTSSSDQICFTKETFQICQIFRDFSEKPIFSAKMFDSLFLLQTI